MTRGPGAPRRIAFVITIDTEGDNLWSRPRRVSTRNAEYLPRFQELCERYALRPTYLATWEMAHAAVFREFGHALVVRGQRYVTATSNDAHGRRGLNR